MALRTMLMRLVNVDSQTMRPSDRRNQIVFAGNTITIFDEIDENIEDLRLQRHQNIPSAQVQALAANT